ncbi:MAG: O-antigen ligase family protein, partial [Trebonia sp.]
MLVLVAWFALSKERIESGATLVAAAVPGAVVAGVAFALPGVTSDFQSSATRWRDGLIFGALLLAGVGFAVVLSRAPRPRDTPALRRVLLAAGVLALIAVVTVGVLKAGSFTGSASVSNSSSRFTSGSSNFRTVWWQQAWDGWEHHKLVGTGAGSFQLTNLLYRDSYLDVTTEPHDLPIQFLSEAGLVGLALFLAMCTSLLRPGLRRVRTSGHELALALILPAFLVHSLVDVDWDFVAVSAPAFLVAGALAGRPPLRRFSPFATLAGVGVATILFGVLLLPWLGTRWANDALGAAPTTAVRLANRAHSVDPLLVEPYWAKAYATSSTPQTAFGYYKQAVDAQPKNP